MKPLALNIALLILVSLICMGGTYATKKYVDSSIDTLKVRNLEVNQALKDSIDQMRDSIESLKKKVNDLTSDVSNVNTPVWIFGGALAGILFGITVAFGFLYQHSSKQAAKEAFQENFENYAAIIKERSDHAKRVSDEIESKLQFLTDAEITESGIADKVEDKYKENAGNSPK